MSLAEIIQELPKLSGDERSVVLQRLRELEDRGGRLFFNQSAGLMVQSPRARPSGSDHQLTKPTLSPVMSAKLQELAALKPGWDEEGALPIDARAIEETAIVIARLSSTRDFRTRNWCPLSTVFCKSNGTARLVHWNLNSRRQDGPFWEWIL